MRDGWAEVRLGDVLVLDNSKLGEHDEEPVVFSLSKYDGVVLADDYFDKRIASDKLDGYKVLGPGGWAYSTIHIDEGSIATNHHGLTGVLSPMYTTMRWVGQDDDPRYFELLLRTPRMLTVYRDHAAGTVNRRRSLAYKAFAELRVDVPPLVVQRRVVDLVDAVDTYAAAGRWLGEVAGRCLVAAISDHEADVPAGDHSRPLSDYVAHTIGGVWGVEPGGDEVDVAVVRSTEFRNDGALGGSGVRRSITMRQLDSRRLQDGDILLEKSGGGPKQPVGRVVSVQDIGSDPTVCANFVQLVRPDPDAVNPRYLFHRMWGWHRAGRTLEYQAQTTGIRNLRTKDYLAQPISLPERAEQDRLADLWDALVDMTTAAVTNAEDAGVLRASLLDELLSGEREIPGSYDELVRLVA